MRILIVSYGSLSPELGASQMALNLEAALRRRGHQAIAWAPPPLPAKTPWWRAHLWRRRSLRRFLASSPQFDVIDLPPVAVERSLATSAPLIARSVQPDLRYLACDLRELLHRPWAREAASRSLHLLHALFLQLRIVRGWSTASRILCLGTGEREWMSRHLPWTRPKLLHYLNAPSPDDQRSFGQIRARRHPGRDDRVRFLWIGRWAPHKGTELLLRFLGDRIRTCPGDSVTLAGCGPAASDQVAGELVASGRVRMVPSFDRSELLDLLRQHDAGLFTSSVEGWGLSLNEMLESGLPVFATPAGGVPDLTPFFPTQLHGFPPPRQLGGAARSTAGPSANYYEHCTWEKIAERYEKLVLRDLAAAVPR